VKSHSYSAGWEKDRQHRWRHPHALPSSAVDPAASSSSCCELRAGPCVRAAACSLAQALFPASAPLAGRTRGMWGGRVRGRWRAAQTAESRGAKGRKRGGGEGAGARHECQDHGQEERALHGGYACTQLSSLYVVICFFLDVFLYHSC
jgi:hypothetical protein